MIKHIICFLFHKNPILFAEGGDYYRYFFSTKCCDRIFSVPRSDVVKLNEAFDRVEYFSGRG